MGAQPVEEEMKEGCDAKLRPSNAVVNIQSWRLSYATGAEGCASIRITYNKSLLGQHSKPNILCTLPRVARPTALSFNRTLEVTYCL
jgi:hypothetical protein